MTNTRKLAYIAISIRSFILVALFFVSIDSSSRLFEG